MAPLGGFCAPLGLQLAPNGGQRVQNGFQNHPKTNPTINTNINAESNLTMMQQLFNNEANMIHELINNLTCYFCNVKRQTRSLFVSVWFQTCIIFATPFSILLNASRKRSLVRGGFHRMFFCCVLCLAFQIISLLNVLQVQ